MKHLEVLVFTNNTLTPRIINWKVATVNQVEVAIEKLQQRPYNVVAISKAVSNSDKMKLQRLISILFDSMIVVEYNNETDVSEKVKTAYWSVHRPDTKRDYLDNAFEIKLAHSINK